MKSSEKAEDLFRSFYEELSGVPKDHWIVFNKEDRHVISAKNCALMAVEEILNSFYFSDIESDFAGYINFWSSVKLELLKI